MLELLTETIFALQSQAASYPQGVQIWMRVMGMSFIASLLFVYNKPAARWILLAFVLNLLGLVMGKLAFPEASRSVIGTIVHLLFWPVILFAVWRPSVRPKLNSQLREGSLYDKIHLLWLCWVSVLLLVSLVLDLRGFMLLFL